MTTDEQQVLALSAVFQAGLLADQLASSGQCNRLNMTPLFDAVLKLDAPRFDDVYPQASALRPGLTLLRNALSGKQDGADLRAIGHGLALVQLAQGLRRDEALTNILRNRLEVLAAMREQFTELTDVELCRRLGGIYLDTLSTLKFRIRVQGEPAHLQDEDNAATIRALFLAGVRGAFLWHQAGGRRWHLLLRRQRLLHATRTLLA